MKTMTVEANSKFARAKDTFEKADGGIMIITPPVSEDYWLFRVKLFRDQSILAFPKFGTMGIGFAKEEDWNTNLPYTCDAIDIYNHISHNKKYKKITKEMCIVAIKLIQECCKKFTGISAEKEKEIRDESKKIIERR